MRRINTDTLIAIFLLLFCGVFIAASFSIRETNFGQMGSEVWPQVILVGLTLLSLLLLAQSVRASREGGRRAGAHSDPPSAGLSAWLSRYRNALWCYLLFALFLITLPVFGMLIGGAAFVFGMLTVLGEHGWRDHLRHLCIAVGAVGAMWAVFTFGLNVILPQGMIFTTL